MDQPEVRYKDFYCKKCFKEVLYGFSYCAFCDMARKDEKRENSRFSYPKFGSRRLKGAPDD